MSIWTRLFRGARDLPVAEVANLVKTVVAAAREASGDRARYRQLLRVAVEKGDLDGPLNTYRGANSRANTYIEKG